MDIFGFFDYTPKDFINKSARDILDMKQNKVKTNFEKKYEANEDYMNNLTEDQKKAIFLLRVLKKGLSKEDKDNTLKLCNIENDDSLFKSKRESVREPSIKEDTNTSRRSMSPGNKSASQQIEEEQLPKETSTEVEEAEESEEAVVEEQPQQEGGKKHKKRKTNRKRKGKKRTQKRKY